MPRYAAFLRGVTPMNASMAELRRAFEAAGFESVRTILASGNVVFDSRSAQLPVLEKKVEAAIESGLGRRFLAIVRPVEELRRMLERDPYTGRVNAAAKRIVTFVRGPVAALKLPVQRDGATLLRLDKDVLFSAYLPTPKGPVFMALIERAVGKEQTTRTWQTLEKVARS
jgi:uncharacterized protein (DUF1697 family)